MKLSNLIFALILLLSFQTNTMTKLLPRIYRSSLFSNPSRANRFMLDTRIRASYFSTPSFNSNQQNQEQINEEAVKQIQEIGKDVENLMKNIEIQKLKEEEKEREYQKNKNESYRKNRRSAILGGFISGVAISAYHKYDCYKSHKFAN